MNIKDLKPKLGKIDLIADVVSKDAPRSFEKFGKSSKVCDAKLKDSTGEVKFTLWNEQVDQVNVGDKIHITNGYADEFKGTLQLSTGKFGAFTMVSKAPDKAINITSKDIEDDEDKLDEELGDDEEDA